MTMLNTQLNMNVSRKAPTDNLIHENKHWKKEN